ncbi:hypothetical protein VE04_09990, partial [Pseudogymnoascus sp. 24MN13]
MSTYEECYEILYNACEKFITLYDPLGIELEAMLYKRELADKYDPGFAEAMEGGGLREEEGARNGEGGQEKGTQTEGTQTEEVTQKE